MDKIRVLVIDDSAFARKVIREILQRDPGIEVVGIARDGIEGLEKIAELAPDVITLDLMMPDLDGLGVLKALPEENPPKVLIVTTSGSDSEIALEALSLGAVDLVNKPTPLPTDRFYDMSAEIIRKVKASASARTRSAKQSFPPTRLVAPVSAGSPVRLVVIGTSTGGPQALSELFGSFPAGLPVCFAIALHIPAGYTASLAARLSLLGGVKITEARDGMEIHRGEGVIAPGGMHLTVYEQGNRYYCGVSYEPADRLHHPSVDVLFASAAKLGPKALGVILTGMGSDGALGASEMVLSGGRVFAESAASCVVYGMPRSVIEAGTAAAEAPLEEMANLILEFLK